MNIWELTILKIIENNHDTASLQNIYSQLRLYIELSEQHLEVKFKAPKYHHQTRAHINDLLKKSELIRVEKGLYMITSKGKNRLLSQTNF